MSRVHTEYVGLLLSKKILDEVDDLAKEKRWSRSNTIRVAIEEFIGTQREDDEEKPKEDK